MFNIYSLSSPLTFSFSLLPQFTSHPHSVYPASYTFCMLFNNKTHDTRLVTFIDYTIIIIIFFLNDLYIEDVSLLRAYETLWSARKIALLTPSTERERHTENVFHVLSQVLQKMTKPIKKYKFLKRINFSGHFCK